MKDNLKELGRVKELQEITGGTRSTDNSKPPKKIEKYKPVVEPSGNNIFINAIIVAIASMKGSSW